MNIVETTTRVNHASCTLTGGAIRPRITYDWSAGKHYFTVVVYVETPYTVGCDYVLFVDGIDKPTDLVFPTLEKALDYADSIGAK